LEWRKKQTRRKKIWKSGENKEKVERRKKGTEKENKEQLINK
jgi:hypothetical protein